MQGIRVKMRGGYLNEIDFITGLVRYSVPSFLMISGKFLLSKENNCEYVPFLRKHLGKIILPLILASVFGVIFGELNHFLLSDGNYLSPVISFLKGRPFYHLWYVYTLIGIYSVVPMVVYLRNTVSKKEYILFGVVWFLASCISAAFCDFDLAWGVHTVACFSSYLVIGDILGNSNMKYNSIWCFLIAAVCLILTGTWEVFQNGLEGEHVLNYINASNNFSPTVAVASMALFLGVRNLNIKLDISGLASETFLIYLIHAFALEVIVKSYNLFICDVPNPFVWFPICSIGVFVLSFAFIKLMRWVVFRKRVRRTPR